MKRRDYEAAAKAIGVWVSQFEGDKLESALYSAAVNAIAAYEGDRVFYKINLTPINSQADMNNLTRLQNMGVLVRVSVTEREPQECPDCGGLGWTEGMESDPRDETGQTPMQVQVACRWPGHVTEGEQE